MKQFELYFKIIKKNALQFIIYMGIFIIFASAMTLSNSEEEKEFQIADMKVGVINHDKEGVIARGIIDYVKKSAEYVELDEEESIQDTLFFRKAEYIIIIPQGFTESLIEGKEVKLEKIQIPGSYTGVYLDAKINQYLSTLNLYLVSAGRDIKIDEILENVNEDLREEVAVETTRNASLNSRNPTINYYFNFSIYSVLSIAILGIGSVISVNREPNIRKRNLVSPVKSYYMDLVIIMGSFILIVVVWAVCILLAIFIYKESVLTPRGYLHFLNLLVVSTVTLSIGFLIGSAFTNNNVRTAATNTVSLGLCFLSGVFVPQEMLSQNINLIASFTPIYWYVRGNDEISTLLEVNVTSIKPIVVYMGIQLLFAAAIMSAGLLLSKQKSLILE